jgi:hypothetical protein
MIKWVVVVVSFALNSVAAAQPAPSTGSEPIGVAPPSPANEPGFVIIDSTDVNSRGGLDASYLEPNTKTLSNSLTLIRLDGHARYVDPVSGFGGYAQIPFAYARASASGMSHTITDFNDAEVGGIFVPKLNVPNIGLVLHAGLALPTGEKGGEEYLIGLFESVARIGELYNSIPRGTTAKIGVSPMIRQGNLFARFNLGVDWNFAAANNVSIGRGIHYDVGVGFELGKAAVMLESANLSITEKDHVTFNLAAVSARFDAGSVLPYIALLVPLEKDTSDVIDFAVTAGADFKIP